MKKKQIVSMSLIHALSVFLYTLLISWVLFNGERWFGEMSTFVGPALMLLLLVVSATITGLLVLGRPTLLFLDDKKKESFEFLGFTVGWMLVIVLATMVGLIVF